MRPFAPDAFDQACDFLAVAESRRTELKEAVVSTTRQLAPPALDVRSAATKCP
jgi:hypothetical protein